MLSSWDESDYEAGSGRFLPDWMSANTLESCAEEECEHGREDVHDVTDNNYQLATVSVNRVAYALPGALAAALDDTPYVLPDDVVEKLLVVAKGEKLDGSNGAELPGGSA